MLNAFKFFAILITLACIFSCSLVSFEDASASVSVGENQNYYEEEFVFFSFSEDINKTIAENFIVIKEENASVEKEMKWFGNTCFVKSKGGFKKGCKYSVSLKGALPAIGGNVFQLDIHREFIFGNEKDFFEITTIESPVTNSKEKSALLFTFNKPVNAASFEKAFNISPSLDIRKDFSLDKRKVSVSAQNKWKANQYYSWTIDGLLSEDGAKTIKNYSGEFIAAQKSDEAKVKCVCPFVNQIFFTDKSLDNLWQKEPIGIIFDTEMNFESVKKGVLFSPAIDGTWKQIDSKHFAFSPYENYKIDQKYTMTVNKNVEDTLGIKMKEEKNYFFTIQNEFIKLEILCEGKKLKKEKINLVEIQENEPLFLEIRFSKDLAKKSIENLCDVISIERFFPEFAAPASITSISPRQTNLSWLWIECRHFDLPLDDKEFIYKIKIKGGKKFIFNEDGEYLKEDECFLISLKKAL
ncbi:MAG: Ig-like domain-containing protein [Treponema sp.]|nr:Ig-like domain-containing protein [Treponema sp.]